MKLTTITDAQNFVANSGVNDWEWGGTASADRFAEFLFRTHDEISNDESPQQLQAALAAYLRSEGENPADYL